MPIYCALAFGAISISSNGYIKPCCNLDTDSFLKLNPNSSINNNAMVSIRESLIKNEWPKACKNCEKIEKISNVSMRNIYNDKFKDKTIPLHSVVDTKNIIYADIFLSRKCNSKCLTCNPASSDYWQEEFNFIYNQGQKSVSPHKTVSFTLEKGVKLIEECPNIVDISFIGGEPTIINSHIEFLEYLVYTNKSKNISLSYNTNLTSIDSKLIEMWKNFKNVGLNLSIDGYGKVNEYIRYPFKWSKVDDQIDTLLEVKNINIGLACTISVFNFVDVPDLLEYWYKKLSNVMIDDRPVYITSYLNRVTNPDFMEFTMLSNEYRKTNLKKCQQLIDIISKENRGSHNLIETLNIYKHHIEEPQNINDEKINKLKYFINRSDLFRNRNIKDFLPSLAKELNLWI